MRSGGKKTRLGKAGLIRSLSDLAKPSGRLQMPHQFDVSDGAVTRLTGLIDTARHPR